MQVGESFASYAVHTGLRQATIYGGVSQRPQEQALHKGVDILIATPGRLLDLMNQKLIDLSVVEIFVLDEADRMLDMGFIPDIRRVIGKLPEQRQTLLFSATIPYDIARLADTILRDPVRVSVAPPSAPAEAVEHFIYYVEKAEKARAAEAPPRPTTPIKNALVFTRTRHSADRVERFLSRAGIRTEAIHGDKSQGARERALVRLQEGDDPGPGGHGHRRAGAGHRRAVPRGQLRHTERAGGVRPPHRPHGKGRPFGDRHLLLRLRGAAAAGGDRAADPEAPHASWRTTPSPPRRRRGPRPRLERGRPEPRPRPYMITVDASFLSSMRTPAAGAPPSRASRHAEDEARPTAGSGGRKGQHRDAARPARAFRK